MTPAWQPRFVAVTTPPDDSGTSLDDFLSRADESSGWAEPLERIGLGMGLLGTTIAIGLVVVAIGVLTQAPRDTRVLLRITEIAGATVAIGAVLEIAGFAAQVDQSWSDVFNGDLGAASMMRIIGGAMIALGWVATDTGRLDAGSSFGVVGLATAALSFGFDGHTVTQGIRGVHLVVDLVHVTAGGVWFGGIVALVALGVAHRRRGDDGTPVGELVIRFSPVASIALIVVAGAGVLMTLMIIDGFGDLTGTTWGKLLIAKVAVVAATALVGAYNHFRVVPALERDPDDAEYRTRISHTLRAEAILLTAVVVLTTFLVTASIV